MTVQSDSLASQMTSFFESQQQFSSSSSTPSAAAIAFPPQWHEEYDIEGTHTDVISTVYSDRVFVVISQLDKIGTLIKASSEQKSDGGYLYHITTLMGRRDDPLLSIYARQIVERLTLVGIQTPLLLAISLEDSSRSTNAFQAIINHLFDKNAWSM